MENTNELTRVASRDIAPNSPPACTWAHGADKTNAVLPESPPKLI
jgi:hypothetical protein